MPQCQPTARDLGSLGILGKCAGHGRSLMTRRWVETVALIAVHFLILTMLAPKSPLLYASLSLEEDKETLLMLADVAVVVFGWTAGCGGSGGPSAGGVTSPTALNGQYAFVLSGFDSALNPISMAGSFGQTICQLYTRRRNRLKR